MKAPQIADLLVRTLRLCYDKIHEEEGYHLRLNDCFEQAVLFTPELSCVDVAEIALALRKYEEEEFSF